MGFLWLGVKHVAGAKGQAGWSRSGGRVLIRSGALAYVNKNMSCYRWTGLGTVVGNNDEKHVLCPPRNYF